MRKSEIEPESRQEEREMTMSVDLFSSITSGRRKDGERSKLISTGFVPMSVISLSSLTPDPMLMMICCTDCVSPACDPTL